MALTLSSSLSLSISSLSSSFSSFSSSSSLHQKKFLGPQGPPVVFPTGMKVNSETYRQFVLEPLKAWLEESYGPIDASTTSNFVLMQDGAPAHTSRATQGWLEMNLGVENFWSKTMWPPSSPDANPLDFSFWVALAGAVGAIPVPQSRAALI